MRAAVVWEPGAPFDVRDDVRRREPGPDEVVVRVRATGVCQTDIALAGGAWGQPCPVVLGHEAAGQVLDIGTRVRSVLPGDHVVVNWVPPCDRCPACRAGRAWLCAARRSSKDRGATGNPTGADLTSGGVPLLAGMGTATFADECVLPEAGVVPVDDDVPFAVAALLGCAVPTGVGAALRSGGVRPGDTVLVVGCGAVGLNAVQGAVIGGAAVVAAVDPLASRREMAVRLGATAAFAPEDDPAALTAGGFDVGIDAVGSSRTIRTVWDAIRRGGTAVVVGAGRADDLVAFSAYELFHDDKRLAGSWYGSSDLRRELPGLVALWRSGRLVVDALTTPTVDLAAINEVVAAQRDGSVVRTVLHL